jgi:tetratricopeptide (TPR) repeat protein
MNPNVLRRFIVYLAIATFVMFSLWAVLKDTFVRPPGDFEVQQGDILLTDEKFEEALAAFDEALEKSPDHRGALMGRALVFMKSGRRREAVAELTYLIDFLRRTLASEDLTGRATLAAAYANRGILHDRAARYEKALTDYASALKIDEESVSGPNLVDKILYGTPNASSVRKRAEYLIEQLALPENQRLLRVPEIDAEQRIHKP